MKYAHLDTQNKILGWYDDSIHTEIPTPNIEVQEEVWQAAININANCYENEMFIVKDFRTVEEITGQELKSKIQESQQYLNETSWIWEKYNRNVLVLKDLTDDEFQTKYNDIILLQEEARLNINKLELELEALISKGAK